jgi:uncharacterized membrane protein
MNARPGRGRGLALGNRLAPPRFLGFLVLLAAGFLMLSQFCKDDWRDLFAMAFDFAAACFLISLLPLLRDSSAEAMRRHAADNDANRTFVLIITSILALVVMAAIGVELQSVKDHQTLAITKLVTTLLLVWFFANTIYALHYAHAWYRRDPASGGDCGGLDFPGTAAPDYADFAYFAFTLGMTFQTSDVGITSRGIRRVVLLHSFAAFVFNIGVIAFSINAVGGT